MEENKGKHLTLSDRREIEDMLNKGYEISRIAIRLGKTYNAIKYEVVQHSRIIKLNDREENGPDAVIITVYDAEVAHHKAYTKRHLASFRGEIENWHRRITICVSLHYRGISELCMGRTY